ncbi:copper resistance CopC/CopD family protein [Cohnella nanjingensis]|uniref:Copper resistance protein CopC/CopD n=1 Tax=Cohnella nanjingensis TaxID=1387779 RepID=A0A7X0VDI3_9BACL|nr:copper resistance protein CopC [Cohnella nanjingensis]MBB6669731.1 copper resistance protein CopC/CopD [Cohnella nanjingensis]
MTHTTIDQRIRLGGKTWARVLYLLLGLLLAGGALAVQTASAHASLVQATPQQDAKLTEAPSFVELRFSERLDAAEARLRVLDDQSKAVTSAKPERFDQGKGLRLALPKLGEGHYTVTYDVISADGHPVSGAYVFTVGNPPPLPDASQLDPHAQIGHAGHNHGGGQDLTTQLFLLYASRIAYYAGLLVLAGLMLWSLYRSASPIVREAREGAVRFVSKYTTLAIIAYVVFQMANLTQGEPFSEWGRILTETTIGRLYAAELLLALAAPLLSGLGTAGRLFWAAVALFIEAWSGHAAAFSPIAYTVGLDFVHLLAASLWGGGLALLVLVWRKERPEAGRFALVFSKWALIAFLLLWVTGALSTLAFLPTLEYLLYTAWGTWLLVKAGLSLLVVVAAFLIRLRLRRGDLPHGHLLKADLGLLAGIVFCVGIFTYQTPLPANAPLSFHEMGTDMHVTLRITPNVPGDNAFTLKVWTPEKAGDPKSIALRLKPLDREDIGAIEVPLKPYEDSELDDFPEYNKYTFKAQGPYLAFRGKWEAEIRVVDANGDELKPRKTTFRIY